MSLLDVLFPGRQAAAPVGPVKRSAAWWASAPVVPSSVGPVERMGSDFTCLVMGGLMGSSAVAAVEDVRTSVFGQGRFLWQHRNNGRPGDFFFTGDLAVLERPWTGGTTGDLLVRMLLHADFAGNAYVTRVGDELVLLRPDWVDIVLTPRLVNRDPLLGGEDEVIGWQRVGYVYWHKGKRSNPDPVLFAVSEVAHFAPKPDPLASYRGMSWLTPLVREIEADQAMTEHKAAFMQNAATPNLAVALPREIDPEDFDEFVELMEKQFRGPKNAGRTLYLGGGADPTVLGRDFAQLDFKAVQGAGETRIAAAGGVGAVLAKLSEGLQGSSLNAGNFGAARRLFADTTAQSLWQNVAASLEVLMPRPTNLDGSVDLASQLAVDTRDVPFMRDDATDAAAIQASRAVTLRQYLDAGWTPESAKAALIAGDESLLEHSGLFSVQLQPPSSGGVTP